MARIAPRPDRAGGKRKARSGEFDKNASGSE